MAFKDNILEFFDNKIVDTESGIEVMMDWEDDIMEKSAEFICHNKGDILKLDLVWEYVQITYKHRV